MDLNQKIVLKENVFSQNIDDEIVLLDMQSENYFGVDGVGTVILQKIVKPLSLQSLKESLLEQYDVEEEVLESDMLSFIEKLYDHELIEVTAD